MTSSDARWKCDGCGLVNLSATSTCRRCGAGANGPAPLPPFTPLASDAAPTSSPPLHAAQIAERRITGLAFTAFGFTTWKIVCLRDAIIFVRTPWYAGIPAVLLSVVFGAVPLGTCRATLSGKNTMVFGSIVSQCSRSPHSPPS